MNCDHSTDFLYAQPSFLEGVGRILDFGDVLTEFNHSQTGEIADQIAIYLDYSAVGTDIYRALQAAGPPRLAESR